MTNNRDTHKLSDRKNLIKNIFELFLISFLALFFEVLLIRWIPSNIQILAFFTNIVLISCFLGLGIGCLLSELNFDLMNLFSVLVFVLTLFVVGFSYVPVTANQIQDEILRGFYSEYGINFLFSITVVFIFSTMLFVTLGQKLGVSLKSFQNPLLAYSINIFGSLVGVLTFSYLSYLMTYPVWWFFWGMGAALWFVRFSIRRILLHSFILFLTIYIVGIANKEFYWSPYHKVSITPLWATANQVPQDFRISINNTQLQNAYNLSDERLLKAPELKRYKEIYEFPYSIVNAKKVLVLGAGSGNDVAAALRRGAEEIDAIEIDPFIATLGRSLHREKPYRSDKVKVTVDDARSFIRKTDKKYDLITFGYLDAHRVLSQFSSVRLDNFIYTKESFADIKKRLKPNGLVSLTYLGFKKWVEEKLYAGLKANFGDQVKAVRATTYNPGDTVIFLAGEMVKDLKLPSGGDFVFEEGFSDTKLISDDWPYLYLLKRGIPRHYLTVLAIVLFFALVCIGNAIERPWQRFNAPFFFLGAGFLLLETVSITRFALLFGSTWVVSSIVIVSILVMILLANIVVERWKVQNVKPIYFGLFAAILLNWLIKPDLYLAFNRGAGFFLASLILALPMFFAGMIFAALFKKTKDVTGIFAFNLLGGIVGGACEYFSMQTGFSFLYLLAIAMYALSFYFGVRKLR